MRSAVLIVGSAAAILPVAVRLLLELERYLANSAQRPRRLVASK
jgi:hypothetical protein